MSTETTKKKGPPQIAVLDKALKLAEQWVNNMSESAKEKQEVEPEDRPHRLGLGAKVSRQARAGSFNDPVERRLNAKLDAGKRRAAKNNEESAPSGRDRSNEDDEEDEDLESRTNAFTKKRVVPPTPTLPAKKKQKK